MTARDHTAAVRRAGVEGPPGAVRARLAGDTDLDGVLAARLRDESCRTRRRVEGRLAAAGYLGGEGTACPTGQGADDDLPDAVDGLDARRDLGAVVDEHVDLLERIDALHERRLRSPSARERHASTRVLAEALHRIVEGYEVEVPRARGPVAVAERVDQWVGRALVRTAGALGRPRGALRWWARYGRWTRLGLGLVTAVLLASGAPEAAAVVVTVRSVAATVLFSPDLPDGRPGRVLGYDPAWAACVCTHLGDAAVVAGVGLGLHLGGHSAWGAGAAFVALFSLVATVLRVASGHHGFRLGRLWTDRVVVTGALTAAPAGLAMSGAGRPGVVGPVPLTVAAVAAVAVVGVGEIVRTVYWGFRRRRLFRHGPADSADAVPHVVVARSGDALVMNISRRRWPRARVLDQVPDPGPGSGEDGGRLRLVGHGEPP